MSLDLRERLPVRVRVALSGAALSQEVAPFKTVLIEFENEQVPTGEAGIGACMDVVREGDHLHVLQERNLTVLSLANPAQPHVVDRLEDVGNLRQIVVRGKTAFITAREDGLFVVDVSNPAQPKHLSRVKFDWRSYFGYPDTWRVKLAYPYAYLYHTHNGAFILDVSDPMNPKELRQIRVPLHPGDQGFRAMPMNSKNGLRQPVLPFDPTQKIDSPVCGLVATDGYLYFVGMFSDLHVFHDQKLAKAESGKESPAARGPPPDRTRLTTQPGLFMTALSAAASAFVFGGWLHFTPKHRARFEFLSLAGKDDGPFASLGSGRSCEGSGPSARHVGGHSGRPGQCPLLGVMRSEAGQPPGVGLWGFRLRGCGRHGACGWSAEDRQDRRTSGGSVPL